MVARQLNSLRPPFTRVDWFALVTVLLIHASLVAVPFTFTRGALGVFLGLHCLSGCVGISFGYHRLLTHRAVRVARPVEMLVAVCGCLAWQLSPIDWVATHRRHHSNTDRPDDPHSPHPSFWWGHLGWLMLQDGERRDTGTARRYAPELLADPFYRFLQWSYPFYQLLLGLGLYEWGGWSFVVWGIALRLVVVWHGTWLVNSATHKWGYRRFSTKDHSTNLWWVALLTYGEGWHNNHHGDPRAAVYGRRWWEIDPTWALIRLLEVLRLAWDVHRPRRAETARPSA
jgi:sn-2 palmitoyl-lipid 9-desaturase